ncbi:MAG: CAP domain-containing protein [Acidimicrobiales bacterium]
MSWTTSRRRSARTGGIALAGLAATVTLALGGGVAQAQTPPQCTRINPLACFQVFQPTRPAPIPAPVPAPTPTPVTTPTTSPPLLAPLVAPLVTPSASPVSVPEAARQLLDLVNGERARAGLGQVTSRDDIVTIALEHSQRMAAAGNIFHNDNFFSTTVKNLLGSLTRGENVAQNTSISDTHVRLMNSPGHRANILDGRFNTVGFAVVRTSNGQYWVTEDFAQTRGAPSVAAAAAAAPTAAPPSTRAPAPRPAPVAVPAPVVPVSVDLATEVLSMVDLAPEPVPSSPVDTAIAAGAGAAGLGTSVVILAGFLVAGAALGSWQFRRITGGLWT